MIGWFMGKLGVKGIVIILGVVLITSVVGAATLHYRALVKDNATLTANNKTLTTSLDIQRQANDAAFARLDKFADALKRQGETMEELALATEDATSTLRRIDNVFSKHDFQNLLNKKGGLILRRVNSGTVDLLRLYECETARGGCDDAGATEGEDVAPAGPRPHLDPPG